MALVAARSNPALTKSYISDNQTVSAAGTLTLAHGLAAMPKLVQARLKCLTGEGGYSVGDEVIANPSEASITNAQGLSLVPDATNITVRFGSHANSIIIIRKDTGALFPITVANWALIIYAWV